MQHSLLFEGRKTALFFGKGLEKLLVNTFVENDNAA